MTYIVTIKPTEKYYCTIVEECEVRFGGLKMFRVMLPSGGIVRVYEHQLETV